MPGPLLTVTVSESAHRGVIAGPLIIVGHGLLELILVLALLAGLAPLLKRDAVFITISIIGGCILLWMAISMFQSLPELHLNFDSRNKKNKNLVIAGIMFSLANPFWILWWVSIGLGYIMNSVNFGVLGIASFFIGHILADLAWYTFISFSVAQGRRFFSDTAYRRLTGCCASFLCLFSCYFFYSGIEKLV